MAIPSVGMIARLVLTEYRKQVREYARETKKIAAETKRAAKDVQASTKGMVSSWQDLTTQSKVFTESFHTERMESYTAEVERLTIAFRDLKKGTQINVEEFDRLTRAGYSTEEALRGASSGASEASAKQKELADQQKKLADSLVQTIADIASWVAAFKIAKKAIEAIIGVIRQAVEEFTEYVAEMRQLQLVMGTTSEETVAWAKLMRDSGAQVGTLTRSISYLERQITDLNLRQIEGKDSSTSFSRSLDALGISWRDAQGNMRGADAVMEDVLARMRELGPSSEASALALRLFGRAGARDLLPVLFDSARSLAETEEQAKRLGATATVLDREVFTQWKLATSDLNDATTGFWLTVGRELIPELTKLVKIAVEVVNGFRLMFASISAADLMLRRIAKVGFKEAREEGQKYFNYLTGVLDETQQKQEELAKAEQLAAANALFEAEAQEELANKIREVTMEINELIAERNEKFLDIEREYSQKLEDIERERGREQIERGIKLGSQLRELWIKHQERLADIARKNQGRLKEVEDERQEKLGDAARDAQKKREDLERKHQERLWKIQTQYRDAIEDAARSNDAVAVVAAIRRRNREIRDAERQRQTEARDIERDLAEKRRKINEDAEKKRQERQKEEEDKVAEENLRYQRELQRLQRQQEEQRLLRQLQQQWELEDLQIAKDRELAELERWYQKEKTALEQQIADLTAQQTAGILAAGLDIAAATSTAIGTVAAAAVAAIGSTGLSAVEQWRNRHRYLGGSGSSSGGTRPSHRRAEGGLDIMTRPTNFTAGDAGPEMLLSVPLSGQMRHQHMFSKLPVEFSGAPQGMNQGAVQAMMFEILTHFAEQLDGG